MTLRGAYHTTITLNGVMTAVGVVTLRGAYHTTITLNGVVTLKGAYHTTITLNGVMTAVGECGTKRCISHYNHTKWCYDSSG